MLEGKFDDVLFREITLYYVTPQRQGTKLARFPYNREREIIYSECEDVHAIS